MSTFVKSAFSRRIRAADEHIDLNANEVHVVPYLTGGLQKLIKDIKNDEVNLPHDFGHHTSPDGHFSPQGECLMGMRYLVKEVLDTRGQSAVLVLAEDLFKCRVDGGHRLVVIKVLHSQHYNLGAQESHVLTRVRVADPLNHSHTLRLLRTLTFDSHFCMVFEPLLPGPLTTVFQQFSSHEKLDNLRTLGLRLLTTIGFLHQQNMIHTDLKPENILLKYENDLDSVHIVDFGNTINYTHREMSMYYKDFKLQTPLYRAPEVMFGVLFGPEIDIWSLGCILAELYIGKPLFFGNTNEDILIQVTELLGPFPAHKYRVGKYFKQLRKYTSDESQDNGTLEILAHLQEVTGARCTDIQFADLLSGLLKYDPDERLTVSQAAMHPFFASHFPIAFLQPKTSGVKQYCSGVLPKVYSFSPEIAESVRRKKPSSLDLLSIGTYQPESANESIVLKPSPRLGQVTGGATRIVVTPRKSNKLDMLNSVRVKLVTNNSKIDVSLQESFQNTPNNKACAKSGMMDTGSVKGKMSNKDKLASLMNAIQQEQVKVEHEMNQEQSENEIRHAFNQFCDKRKMMNGSLDRGANKDMPKMKEKAETFQSELNSLKSDEHKNKIEPLSNELEDHSASNRDFIDMNSRHRNSTEIRIPKSDSENSHDKFPKIVPHSSDSLDIDLSSENIECNKRAHKLRNQSGESKRHKVTSKFAVFSDQTFSVPISKAHSQSKQDPIYHHRKEPTEQREEPSYDREELVCQREEPMHHSKELTHQREASRYQKEVPKYHRQEPIHQGEEPRYQREKHSLQREEPNCQRGEQNYQKEEARHHKEELRHQSGEQTQGQGHKYPNSLNNYGDGKKYDKAKIVEKRMSKNSVSDESNVMSESSFGKSARVFSCPDTMTNHCTENQSFTIKRSPSNYKQSTERSSKTTIFSNSKHPAKGLSSSESKNIAQRTPVLDSKHFTREVSSSDSKHTSRRAASSNSRCSARELSLTEGKHTTRHMTSSDSKHRISHLDDRQSLKESSDVKHTRKVTSSTDSKNVGRKMPRSTTVNSANEMSCSDSKHSVGRFPSSDTKQSGRETVSDYCTTTKPSRRHSAAYSAEYNTEDSSTCLSLSTSNSSPSTNTDYSTPHVRALTPNSDGKIKSINHPSASRDGSSTTASAVTPQVTDKNRFVCRKRHASSSEDEYFDLLSPGMPSSQKRMKSYQSLPDRASKRKADRYSPLHSSDRNYKGTGVASYARFPDSEQDSLVRGTVKDFLHDDMGKDNRQRRIEARTSETCGKKTWKNQQYNSHSSDRIIWTSVSIGQTSAKPNDVEPCSPRNVQSQPKEPSSSGRRRAIYNFSDEGGHSPRLHPTDETSTATAIAERLAQKKAQKKKKKARKSLMFQGEFDNEGEIAEIEDIEDSESELNEDHMELSHDRKIRGQYLNVSNDNFYETNDNMQVYRDGKRRPKEMNSQGKSHFLLAKESNSRRPDYSTVQIFDRHNSNENVPEDRDGNMGMENSNSQRQSQDKGSHSKMFAKFSPDLNENAHSEGKTKTFKKSNFPQPRGSNSRMLAIGNHDTVQDMKRFGLRRFENTKSRRQSAILPDTTFRIDFESPNH